LWRNNGSKKNNNIKTDEKLYRVFVLMTGIYEFYPNFSTNILVMNKTFLLSVVFSIPFLMASSQNYPKLDEAFRLKQLEPPPGKVRMVLDTDTYNEVDDQFALAYAFLSKEKIELEAVYAAPFHNNRSNGPADGMEKSYDEILRLLKMLGKSPEGFAFRGSNRYLEDVSKPIRSEAALDLVKKAMASSPENPLYVVPVGCITNIASAILIEPEIIKNIVAEYSGGRDAYSKVIWDVTAVAWLVNPGWIKTNLVHSPVLTDQVTFSVNHSRHFIRMAEELNRDAIFRDMFGKLAK
jgi:hypothetical protein